jgi:signal transduction histidine kinase
VLSLRADGDALRLCLTDDGATGNGATGDSAPDGDGASNGSWAHGVGLNSIAERAAEVGGRSEAGPTPDGGRVWAELPLGVRA